MARFVRLTLTDGSPWLMRLSDVLEVHEATRKKTAVDIVTIGTHGTPERQTQYVKDSIDEIERLLNGEPAAVPRAPLTAGPRGWETAETGGGS